MIDFNKEIEKYKPIVGINDIDETVKSDEILDIMDLLQHIINNIPKS